MKICLKQIAAILLQGTKNTIQQVYMWTTVNALIVAIVIVLFLYTFEIKILSELQSLLYIPANGPYSRRGLKKTTPIYRL